MQRYFNKWTLALKDKEIQTALHSKTLHKYNKCNIIILSILTLHSVSLLIVLACVSQRYSHCDKATYDYYVNYAICSIISLLNLILLALIVQCPSMILQRIIIHYVSVSIFVLYIILRFILFYSKINDLICFSLTTLEFCYRFLFVVIGIMNFVDLLITCGIVLVIHTSLFVASFHLMSINLANSYFYYIFLVMTVILCYFFHRKDIISFCYEFKLNESCEWHKNLLTASNAGVMKIEKEKVVYLSKKAEELMLKSRRISQLVTENSNITSHGLGIGLGNSSSSSNNENSNSNNSNDAIDLTKVINRNLNLVLNELIETTPHVTANEERSKVIVHPLEYLKDKYEKENKKEFIYLNHKTFYSDSDCNEEMVTIELLYCYLTEKDNSDVFEFIFNDVTCTKRKTEFQYKSMFFSKIAHEFKSPLITIGELAEKISETLSLSSTKQTEIDQRANIDLIKALSQYMYSLSKDLECFSQIQMKPSNEDNNVFISDVDIEKTVQFVKSIANGLLIRYHKINQIEFNVVISNDMPQCIRTDEVKLRQVLINLISNSIKFTNEGSVTLSFELDGNNNNNERSVKISVTDTGIGLDEDIQNRLFTPFCKMIENNPTGVGLGLCIVRELTSKIGTRIKFHSQPNQGSSFYFTIPLMTLTSENIKQSKEHLASNQHYKHQSTNEENNDNSCSSGNNNNNTIIIPHISLVIPQYNNKKTLNILIADDEQLIREASIRILKRYALKRQLIFNIIECNDGFELLYKVTTLHTNNNTNINTSNHIDLIICDENMSYCNGYDCYTQLSKLFKLKKLIPIDFCILSSTQTTPLNNTSLSLSSSSLQSNNIFPQYQKPLTEDTVQKMLDKIGILTE